MKLLIRISLFIAGLSQLCSASYDATKDKRYPIFNLLATKVNEYTMDELVEYSHLYSDLWPQFNETIASADNLELYKSKDYHEFYEALKEFYEAVKKLEADKENCDIQKIVQEKLRNVSQLEMRVKFREFDKYQNRVEQIKYKSGELIAEKIIEIYDQLPAAIESFYQQGIDKIEKDQYGEAFLNGCKKFLEAKTDMEKYICFEMIASSLNPNKIEDDHCKWNANAYINFMLKIIIYVDHIVKINPKKE